MTFSSQSNSYRPSSGSSLAQAKMATDTQLMCAAFISSISFLRISGRSSHWSGL